MSKLDETFENENGDTNSGSCISHELRFTGNWFIDAGILGFVNLMEEVYGWDLEKTKKTVANLSTEKLLGYFTYAFWYKIIKDTITRWLGKDIFRKSDLQKEEKIDINVLKKNLRDYIVNEISKKNIGIRDSIENLEDAINAVVSLNNFVKELVYDRFLKYKKYLKKVFASNKKTLLDQLKSIGIVGYNDFFTNLYLFNPSSNTAGKEKELLYIFKKMILEGYVREDKKIKNIPVDVLDKSLSPFIYSASDFHNEYYGKPMTLGNLKVIPTLNPIIFVLSKPFAFIWIAGNNYFFYTFDLEFTYNINRKLKYYITKVKSYNKGEILKITWRVILDTLVEYKSQYSLENMYILEFSDIQNQQIRNVEYIGISKLHASILVDDQIRDALNVNLQTDKDEKDKWLLEEFIKNRQLYDLISRHIFYCLRTNKRVKRKSSLYALAIDAKIKENNRIDLFSDDFFRGYRSLVNEIRDCYSTLNLNALRISQLFDNAEERQKLCYSLVSALKRKNRIAFVNALLKKLLEKSGYGMISQLTRFIFENIVSNDISWENYALALVIGILSGGEVVGDESEYGE